MQSPNSYNTHICLDSSTWGGHLSLGISPCSEAERARSNARLVAALSRCLSRGVGWQAQRLISLQRFLEVSRGCRSRYEESCESRGGSQVENEVSSF